MNNVFQNIVKIFRNCFIKWKPAPLTLNPLKTKPKCFSVQDFSKCTLQMLPTLKKRQCRNQLFCLFK